MRTSLPALCALALVGFPTEVVAQDLEWNRYTLEGLGGVFVRIEANETCQAVGVTASAYQADASLRLMESDVGVLTMEEMLEHPGLPELRVSLECASGMGGLIAYSVGVRVQQAVQMIRDTQITLSEGVTWYATTLGASDADGIAAALESDVGAALDAFAAAWAAANSDEEGGRQ